jgi:2-polyprenyl-6-methoxyphenol hydroxylase-like FAD-dependent oxidoreductase
MRVLIGGAGIGGLSLALSLHAAGVDEVEVFEAASTVDELGTGINVLPHAVRELTELGLADSLAVQGLATSEVVMFNKHGQRIWSEPRGLAAGYRWPQYSIHRGRLCGILRRAFVERLGKSRLHLDHRLVGATQDGVRVFALTARGSRVEGDVVVGADGIHSAFRGQLYPDEGPPLWNGVTMWRAIALGVPCLTGSSMVFIGHFGRRAVIYPISRPDHGGRALINIVLEAVTGDRRSMPPQDWDHTVDSAKIRAVFSSMRFNWIDVGKLIEAVTQWWQYPMVDRDPLPSWRSGRITLLGDAAHPMYPVGANGASQAILDARVLARELALAPSVEAALAAYESLRRPATAAVVLANRGVGGEKCMELAEDRAPDGFDRIEDIFAHGELEELSSSYKRIAGFDPTTLNDRASLSVASRHRPGRGLAQ